MNNHLIVLGASAGGIDALKHFLKPFPNDFPSSILIVIHISPHTTSNLPAILQPSSKLQILHPHHKEHLHKGKIYVAPPNLHMTVQDGKILLEHGPKVNHSRPAIDPLFFTAASIYGSCAIGVLLSGLLDDGSAGLLSIKRNKGITFVQDLNEAEYPDMPRNALKNVSIDYCLPVKDIAHKIIDLVKQPIPAAGCITKNSLLEQEIKINKTMCDLPEDDMNKIGHSSVFACPDCHGVLWEVKDDLLRFRCRVGHAYGVESLSQSLDGKIENALWAALRALEEKESLTNRILSKAQDSHHLKIFHRKATLLNEHIKTLRPLLNDDKGLQPEN